MKKWNVKLLIGPFDDEGKAASIGERIEPLDGVNLVYSTWLGEQKTLAVAVRATVDADDPGSAVTQVEEAVFAAVGDDICTVESKVALASPRGDWLTRMARGEG